MFKDLCASGLILIALAGQASAAEVVLYCLVEQTVGFKESDDIWQPFYSDGSEGNRWIIKFQNEYRNVTGIDGTETPYLCATAFPNKAPDVISCVNSRVATMIFSYSIESGHFTMGMISPGGWLGKGTEREQKLEPLTDHLMIGTCQSF